MARGIESEDGERLLVGIWKRDEDARPLRVRLSFDARYPGEVALVYPLEVKNEVIRSTSDGIELALGDPLTLLIKG